MFHYKQTLFYHNQAKKHYTKHITLILIAGFRAGSAGLNLGHPEIPPLKLRKPS